MARGGSVSFASHLVGRQPGSSVIIDSLGITLPAWLVGLVANGLLVAGSFWIARYGFRQARGPALILATAVVFWTACTIGLEFLSAFGAISAGPMLAWAAICLVLGGVVRWLRAVDDGPLVAKGSSPARFSAEALAGLGLLLSAGLILGMRSLLLAVKVVSDGPIYHLYFRGAMVEGRPALSRGGPVRGECGDLFSRQRRSLVHLADGIVGR